MKMAKKILSSLLAASMLLGTLTACGGGNSDTTESAAKSVTEAAASSGNTLTVGMMAIPLALIRLSLRALQLVCPLSMTLWCVWM